jgi:hypothetical protein
MIVVAAILLEFPRFYGRVVDQNGASVEDATVTYVNITDITHLLHGAPKHYAVSEHSGRFSMPWPRGAVLLISAEKSGYDPIDHQSQATFAYSSKDYDRQRDRPPPTRENPGILVLRKKAPASPLYVLSTHTRLPEDAAPVFFDLRSGRISSSGPGDLKFEFWMSPMQKQRQEHFPWRCRISAPGGGLRPRNDEIEQQAPADGYEPEITIDVPADAPQWTSRVPGQYFVLTADGCYARAEITVFAGVNHGAIISSYLNPATGSRNLEADEKIDINVPPPLGPPPAWLKQISQPAGPKTPQNVP